MDKSQLQITVLIIFFIVSALLAGIFFYIFQYRRKKKDHVKETALLNEQYQREILSTQLQTQTQTMQFIGREIHDNVGQKLTLASLYSKQLLNSTGIAADKINTISNIIDESLADLRQLSKSLTHPSLADRSLGDLLQEEAERINSLGSCFVEVTDTTGGLLLQPAQKNILFRMLQEFVQNSLKHAACKKISIHLQTADNNFSVTATDNGKGFDLQQKSNGQGLLNMQRRAEELQAAFELKSIPGQGTHLFVQLQPIE